MPVFSKEGKNILFIHIPKTGGSAVTEFFRDRGWKIGYFDTSAFDDPQASNYVRQMSPQHMHAEPIMEIFDLEKFDSVFSVVRHPLSRFKSEFAFRNPHLEQNDISGEIVRHWCSNVMMKFESNKSHLDNHIRPQVDFLTVKSQIFKLEDGLNQISELEASFAIGKSQENQAQIGEIEFVNRSSVRSQEVPVDLNTLKSLRTIYSQDFSSFDYK